MAVNPVQFLVASNASITDGSKIVNISGNVDCSRVYSGTAVFLGGADNPAEAVSGTSPDGSGNSTITLRNNWSQGDVVNQQMVTFNTNEGLAEAISNVREIVSNVSAIEDLATQGLIKRIDDNTYEVVNISSQGESLITANDASSQRSVMGLGSAATKDVGTAAGNVMEVGAFGLGSLDCPTISDLTQEVQSGLYKFRANYAGAPPDTASTTLWYSVLVTQSLQERVTFVAQLVTGSAPRLFLGERIGQTGSIRWIETYNSGNSVNPLDYGVGVNNVPLVNDINSPINDPSGFYGINNNTVGKPSLGTNVFGIVTKLPYKNYQPQLFTGSSGAGNPTAALRVYDNGAGSFSDWKELYHSGNTNFNEFGGTNAGDVIATGFCVSGSVARFFLPINSITVATGVTVSGAFDVRAANGGYLATGVVPSAVGIHSNRLVAVQVDSLSVSAGDSVWLSAVNSTSKITVNF